MNFNLKHLILLGVLVALLTSLVTKTLQVDRQQKYSMVSFSPNGKLVAVQGNCNTQVFDISTKVRLTKLSIYCDVTPEHVQFTDNKHLLTFGFSNTGGQLCRTVRWHEIKSGNLVRSLPRMSTTEHFAEARDGFVYSNNKTNQFVYYDVDPFESDPLAESTTGKFLTPNQGMYHFRPNCHYFYNGSVRDFLTTGKGWSNVNKVEVGDNGEMEIVNDVAGGLRFNRDGKRCALERKNVFSMHDTDTGELLWKTDVVQPTRTQFSNDGQYVGFETAGESPTVSVFDAESGKLLMKRVTARDYMGAPFAISSEGVLAISRTNKSHSGVELWNVRTDVQLGSVGITIEEPHWFIPTLLNSSLVLAWCVAWVLAAQRRFEGSWRSRLASSFYCGLFFLLGNGFVGFGIANFVWLTQHDLLYHQRVFWPSMIPLIFSFFVGLLIVTLTVSRLLGRTPIGKVENDSVLRERLET